MKHLFLVLYILVGILNIIASALDITPLIYASKPALMIILIIHFLRETPPPSSRFRNIMLAAFVFSWFGDTFLMFVENPPFIEWFFLLGLGSFLITHICYALGFTKTPVVGNSFLKEQPIWIVPFIAFLIGNIMTLWSGIPADMKIPVVVYSSVIVVMALACLNLKGRIPMGIFQLLFLGVVFFVISDTLIGINKFKTPILYGQSWIMLLYLTGQWLIMEGTIKMHKLMNEKPNC